MLPPLRLPPPPLHKRIKSPRAENPAQKLRRAPQPKLPPPHIHRMPPQPRGDKPRQLRRMNRHHAPEQPRLDRPAEPREALAQQPRDRPRRREPAPRAVGQKRGGHDEQFERVGAGGVEELGDGRVGAAEGQPALGVHGYEAGARVAVGGEGRVEGDAVGVGEGVDGHAG